jgi:hypothetical protein
MPWLVKCALEALGLARSTFYDWRSRYRRGGFRGLLGLPRPPIIPEGKLLESERAQIIVTAKSLPARPEAAVCACSTITAPNSSLARSYTLRHQARSHRIAVRSFSVGENVI